MTNEEKSLCMDIFASDLLKKMCEKFKVKKALLLRNKETRMGAIAPIGDGRTPVLCLISPNTGELSKRSIGIFDPHTKRLESDQWIPVCILDESSDTIVPIYS